MKTKKNLLLTACVMLSVSMLSDCSSGTDVEESGVVVNMLPKLQPIKLTDEQKAFANENNGFALNFLKTVNEADQSGQSFVYSPLSITYVLGMVNDAAEGTTREELEHVLGFREGGIEAVNEYCKNLIDNLPNVDQNVHLNIANAIFVNKGYTLKKQFQQDMQQYYGARAESLDFESPKSLVRINNWCSEQTNGMIPNILDQLSKDAVSYLLNAIYFKADWNSKFDPKNTRTEAFAGENGTVRVPMMHQEVLIRYIKNDTYAAVSIPYGSGSWSMVVMLPEEGKTTDDVIAKLAADGWSTNYEENPLAGGRACEVDLKLPRFKTASDTDNLTADGSTLIGLLQSMGIHRAFDFSTAEIPNMCEGRNLFISMMRQKAAIEVDEEGAKAAAVTVAGMEMTADFQEYPKATFHANRPFVYVIREALSGVLLFVGKYAG